jgi:hypothetical protein
MAEVQPQKLLRNLHQRLALQQHPRKPQQNVSTPQLKSLVIIWKHKLKTHQTVSTLQTLSLLRQSRMRTCSMHQHQQLPIRTDQPMKGLLSTPQNQWESRQAASTLQMLPLPPQSAESRCANLLIQTSGQMQATPRTERCLPLQLPPTASRFPLSATSKCSTSNEA